MSAQPHAAAQARARAEPSAQVPSRLRSVAPLASVSAVSRRTRSCQAGAWGEEKKKIRALTQEDPRLGALDIWAVCFVFDLLINLQPPHDLGRRIRQRETSLYRVVPYADSYSCTTPGCLALWLPQGLNGSIRCSGGALIAPTASQTMDETTKPPPRTTPPTCRSCTNTK